MDYREEQRLREQKLREAEELAKVSATAYFNKVNELQMKQEIENKRQKIDDERIRLENERERTERLDPFAVERRKFGAKLKEENELIKMKKLNEIGDQEKEINKKNINEKENLRINNLINNWLIVNSNKFSVPQVLIVKSILENAKTTNLNLILNIKLVNPNNILLLAIFLNIDRFFLNDYLKGILKFITGGGFAIWWLIDIFTAKKRAQEYNFNLIQNAITNF
jgi:hypothetical protein